MTKSKLHTYIPYITLVAMTCVLAACYSTKGLEEGEVLYTGIDDIVYENYEGNDHALYVQEEVAAALNCPPNGAFMGSSKVRMPFPIGFMVWNDIKTHKFRLKKYTLQSKIVLLTSLLLIVLPALFFFINEFADLPLHERITGSLFQSVTTRTAGFNSLDLTQMNESGISVMVILMLIGGSPGSTAGGMKTVTFAVLFLSAITVFRRKKDVQCFKRRISEDTVRSAGVVFFMYLVLFFASGIIISRAENLPMLTCLFETGSAIGTVGLTLGITTKLSMLSKVILMMLMFFGRVGGLTLIYAALPSSGSDKSRQPLENISIG